MTRFILIIIVFLFKIVSLHAQSVIEINSDTSQDFSITDHILILEDPNASFKLENIILSKLDSAFIPSDDQNLNFGFSTSAYWLKFKIINNTQDLKTLYFSIAYPFINDIRFFEFKNATLIRQFYTGEYRDFNSRDFIHRDFVFELKILPGNEYTYYARIYNHGETLRIPLKLQTARSFFRQDYNDLLIKGFFYGLLIFVILFNIFLFITIKDKIYIWFTFYVLSLSLFLMNTDGISFQYLWPENPWWANHSTIVFVSLASLFLLQFAIEFLEVRKIGKIYLGITRALIIISIFICIMSLFKGFFALFFIKSVNYLSLITILFVTYISIIALHKKINTAYYFICSIILLFGGVLMYVLRNMGITPNNLYTLYGVKIGLTSQVLLLSFAVSDRFRKIKERTTRELEELVNIRTAEILNQKEEILTQRDHIAEKNKEITDSILYAQQIQKAIINTEPVFDKVFKEYFILFRPCRIVSGDFYWAKEVEDKILFCAADCTGHGVPGAFMSMLGIALLNEIANEQANEYNAGKILDRLKALLITSLNQTGKEGETRDGMDIALCVLDLSPDNNKYNLQFAGANNPLWIVRKSKAESTKLIEANTLNTLGTLSTLNTLNTLNTFELYELKGDRMPIGIHFGEEKSFISNHLELEKNSQIFLFTDGYADQSGGESGKKMKYSLFKDYLESVYEYPCEEQKYLLLKHFDDWKGNRDQIDDVLVIGIKL